MSWEEESAPEDEGDTRAPTRVLDKDECWSLLAAQPYGRVVTHAADDIEVFPVNHRVDDRTILFRTSAGTKLLQLTIHRDVAFQIDGRENGEAFSVVVKGTAEEVDASPEVEAVGVHPWAPEAKDRWVRISPRHVTGRSFTLPPEQMAG